MIRVGFIYLDKGLFHGKEMPAVPRVGDYVEFGDGLGALSAGQMRVQSVIWAVDVAGMRWPVDVQVEVVPA